jgi:hypothetical protein
MTKLRLFASFILLGATLGAAPGRAAATRQVVVTGTRIHLADVMREVGGEVGSVDLGPAPVAGGSRVVSRADIVTALGAKQLAVPASVPDAVRVVRKARHLEAADLNALVRTAVASKDLARGVSLAKVRADRPVDVADGWTRVDVDVPRAPKKAGTFATTAIASLFVGDEVIARLPVPLDLTVSADGERFDASRGASLTLIVQRLFVEIRTEGFAGADADIGEVLPVQLRPSGRVLRARLVSKDEAIAIDGASRASASRAAAAEDSQ